MTFEYLLALSPALLPTQSSGLGLHLKEITNFQRDFLTMPDGKLRSPEPVTDRQAWLLANVAAPMHDVLKYLGSPKAK